MKIWRKRNEFSGRTGGVAVGSGLVGVEEEEEEEEDTEEEGEDGEGEGTEVSVEYGLKGVVGVGEEAGDGCPKRLGSW